MAVIRVSGYSGAGKTTLCKRLAPLLGYAYHYAGGIFRNMAAEKGLTIEEFYKKLQEDPELEKSIDMRLAALMKKEDNILVEGRIAPFQPTPFRAVNLLLTVDPLEGTKRQLLRKENFGKSLAEMRALTTERLAVEKKRYRDLYGIEDHLGESHFDIVLDTTGISPDEVVKRAEAELARLLKSS